MKEEGCVRQREEGPEVTRTGKTGTGRDVNCPKPLVGNGKAKGRDRRVLTRTGKTGTGASQLPHAVDMNEAS